MGCHDGTTITPLRGRCCGPGIVQRMNLPTRLPRGPIILLMALLVTAALYWPGLGGGWLFDDYPNIVDNAALHIHHFNIPDLAGAALSSPSSELKRPLASLSFAINYLLTGLDPYWMKLTNVFIHLLNGIGIYLLTRRLLPASQGRKPTPRTDSVAALLAGAWLLLPINLTGVLYVVQRMESLANLFVVFGLLGYVAGRQRMLRGRGGGFVLACASLILGTGIGVLAKETAIMLPLYAGLVEWVIWGARHPLRRTVDRRVAGLFVVVLLLPMALGLAWQLPHVFNPDSWATRDFTLGERLLSEARIILGYILWTLLPTPHALSFYHDDFTVSSGWLHPWTTLPSVLGVLALLAVALCLRRRRPLVALGLLLFFGCHLLTGTVLPLELIYEHRNYFASFGLLLIVVPWLATPALPHSGPDDADRQGEDRTSGIAPWPMLRHAVLGGLLLYWAGMTGATALAWHSPLSLAQSLAGRAPRSPRAQYSLGRTYIIDSHYDRHSVFTHMAYAPLERAAQLPQSSILPEQALIFFNARLHLPLKAVWWDTMIAKLGAHKPGVQDESSLSALTRCQRLGNCDLPQARMVQAFRAALSHPQPSARLQAIYSDYAWNVLGNHALGLDMAARAVKAQPGEPAYHITLARMAIAENERALAQRQIKALQALNIGGHLSATIDTLRGELKH